MVNGNGHPLPQCLSRPSPKRVPRAWGFVQSRMTFGDRRVEGPLDPTEQLPLDPDSEVEFDAIDKRSISVRRASQGIERSNPVARQV